MATYDGNYIFGTAIKTKLNTAPFAVQHSAIVGVNGLGSLFLGTRGATVEITGLLSASDNGSPNANRAAVNTLEAVIQSYMDGVARVLVDSLGRTYPYATCGPYIPMKNFVGVDGSAYQTYSVTFHSLS